MRMLTVYSALEMSLLVGAVVAVIKALSGRLNRVYDARWKYWAWLLLAIRLLLPVSLALPGNLISIAVPPEIQEAVRGGTISPPVAEEAASAAMAGPPAAPVAGETMQPVPGASLETMLFFIWAAGACLFLLRQLLAYRSQLRRLLRWSTPCHDARILSLVRMERHILGIRREVTVLTSRHISSPMVAGFFRARLFLPSAMAAMDSEAIVYVLRHELVHLRRHDMWYKLLLLTANAAHWFNPAIYLLFREACADLELSCDAAVLRHGDAAMREAYGRTILAFLPRGSGGIKLSTHFTGGVKTMKQRLEQIMSPVSKRRGLPVLILLLCVMVMSGSLAGYTAAEETIDAEPTPNITIDEYLPELYRQHGIVDGEDYLYQGERQLFGLYDTYRGTWWFAPDYQMTDYSGPITFPPEDSVCLLLMYENGMPVGFEEISHEAFIASLPKRFEGLRAFDEKYGQYKPFGFVSYRYGDRTVRGFWDEVTETSLFLTDPVTGGLYPFDEEDYASAVFLKAVYEGDVLTGLVEISAEEFAAIEGVQAAVEAVRSAYFQ